MNFEQLVDLFKEKGIAGAGGAGFPAYAKLNKKADILILNCAECEPLLRVHRQLLAKYAFEILSTLDTVAKALGGIKVAYYLYHNINPFKNKGSALHAPYSIKLRSLRISRSLLPQA